MGILMALPEIIIEVVEVATAAAEAAAEAAVAAAEVAAEAAIDAAIDAGVEGAVSAAVEGGTDAALDAGLDAAIEGTAAQIARTAGGQAMKKLVEKVGKDAAKRAVNAVKDQVKDGVKDQAKQDLKDYINGKKQPPAAPQTVPVPPAPPGVDIDHPTIDQFVTVENYFKAVHGAFVQARQNENLEQMRLFGPTATHILAGMVNLRQQNFVSFRLKEFDADLGTGSYKEALTVYNGVVTKLLPNLTNEELNSTFDPVKDDLQNKINTAITNTYVPPDVPGPDLTKYRGLKYPLQDPNDYPIILDALKQSNTAFRAAFNVSNKVKMIEYGLDMSECCRDGIAIRKFTQATFDAVEVDGPGATASWEKLNTYWTSVQQNLNFQSNHDDVNKIVGGQLDEANSWLNTMLGQTNTATPEQSQAKKQKLQQDAQQQQPQQQTRQQGQLGSRQRPPQPGKLQGQQPNQLQGQQPIQSQVQEIGATQTTAPAQSYASGVATYAASKLAPHAVNALAPHAARAGTYVAGKLASHAMSTMMPSLAASTQQQQKTSSQPGQAGAQTEVQQQTAVKA